MLGIRDEYYLMLGTFSGANVAITGFDWKAARSRTGAGLTSDEKRIVELLAEGKSTPQIAKLVGTNRSAIWSKAKRIRQKFSNSTA